MAKRGRKKRVVRKKQVRRAAGRVSRRMSRPVRRVRSSSGKIRVVLKNLLVFAILLVVSLVLFGVSTSEFYSDLFLLLSLVSGIVIVAFLIALLVLIFLRIFRR